MSLVAELEILANGLSGDSAAATALSWPSVAERIAKNLAVKTDEVPEALKNVGYIPLTSNSALAARTARESRPEINNNFANAKHATVFEGVKTSGDSAEAIHKIISAPILSGEKVIGVIQISRKGASAKNVGPDFTSGDLGKVLALCKPLGKLLQLVASE